MGSLPRLFEIRTSVRYIMVRSFTLRNRVMDDELPTAYQEVVSMDTMVHPLSQAVESLHEEIFKAVEPLGDAEINWVHPQLSNTIGILLRHVAGSERYWIGEVVGGRAMHRKRETEFTHEPLTKTPLVENLRRAHSQVQEVLRSLSASDLASLVDVQSQDGMRQHTKAWAILHSIQHTSYHLGQIQLFKKMATTAQTAGGRT
ncbi:MAG: DinB family protein [Bacillati bacterium ANGP1]|uniref:DinB family protein n=1 Tax=Candidatus Segetimicrobium genomatis TaxID=2569760 RepID=A0A537LLZ9_9BACT|nr:MAG: DinB family protein [Terrabacteria group bacterium ANGP1]TMJ09031.1 MAG: DinB family protein [Terrabacteria group bacterium ANGP1]